MHAAGGGCCQGAPFGESVNSILRAIPLQTAADREAAASAAASARPPSPLRARPARDGQAPPQRQAGQAPQAAPVEPDSGGGGRSADGATSSDEEPPPPPVAKKRTSRWRAALASRATEWDSCRGSNAEEIYHGAESVDGLRSNLAAEEAALFQKVADLAPQRHLCGSLFMAGIPAKITLVRKLPTVQCITPTAAFPLTFSEWKCSCCGETFTDNPLQLGLLPTSPTPAKASHVIDTRVFDAAMRLAGNGLSFKGARMRLRDGLLSMCRRCECAPYRYSPHAVRAAFVHSFCGQPESGHGRHSFQRPVPGDAHADNQRSGVRPAPQPSAQPGANGTR